MDSIDIVLIVLAGILVVSIPWLISIYNKLVRLRNQSDNGWSQIDVQLKRRHDLIPNLVETVKGYAKHEKETLENVTQARNLATQATDPKAQMAAEAQLGGALSRLLLVAEDYQNLQANQNFLALQEELSSTENKLGFARQHFNDSVTIYTIALESFPANLVAGMFSFKVERPLWEIEDTREREAPKVEF